MASAKTPSQKLAPAEPIAVRSPAVARAQCTQCGKEIRHLPFFIDAITCRKCYGLARYQRGIGMPIGANSMAALAAEEKISS